MKKVSVNLFSIDELKENALKYALEKMYEREEYPYGSDNKRTLYEFKEIFDINVHEWHYDTWHYSYGFEFNGSYEEFEPKEMKGIRLYKWIQNNVSEKIYTGKFYSKCYWKDGKFINKTRHSKVIFVSDCPLSGYYTDMEILSPIIDYLKKPDLSLTLYDLVNQCLDSYFAACHNDYKNWFSDESLMEQANFHEILFFENGKIADIDFQEEKGA